MPQGLSNPSTNVFPIFSGGVGLIFLEVIILATYLKSWALVAPIIASRFLLDSQPLLLKAIGASNSRPFPFQTHLRSMWKLLPLMGYNMCSLFWVIGQDRHRSPWREYFKKITQPFFLLNFLFIYLLIHIQHFLGCVWGRVHVLGC
jgi:hypothetical protein